MSAGGSAATPTPVDLIADMLSNAVPSSEHGSGDAGKQTSISRADHVHPRLSSTAYGKLNADGEATITFTRQFLAKPAWFAGFEDPSDTLPVLFKIKSWATDDNGNYIGCVLKGYRAQLLPALTGGVSSAVTLANALTNFNVFLGIASDVVYSFVAIASTSTK